jgi:hypothetical protein
MISIDCFLFLCLQVTDSLKQLFSIFPMQESALRAVSAKVT